MGKQKKKPEVLLFYDGTQSATEAFVKLISLKVAADAIETVEKNGNSVYNKDVVHLEETSGLVS